MIRDPNFKKGDRVQSHAGDIRGTVMSKRKDKRGIMWYRVRDDNGKKWIIHQSSIMRERMK